jgi:uncharacterized protein with HEPN domain
MQPDQRAYLVDIIDSCHAIAAAVEGMDLAAYRKSRLVRSAVEREFIIIGEAVGALSRAAPGTFGAITNARRIIDFRNQLTHAYATVDDDIVWAIAGRDVPLLDEECTRILKGLGTGD